MTSMRQLKIGAEKEKKKGNLLKDANTDLLTTRTTFHVHVGLPLQEAGRVIHLSECQQFDPWPHLLTCPSVLEQDVEEVRLSAKGVTVDLY